MKLSQYRQLRRCCRGAAEHQSSLPAGGSINEHLLVSYRTSLAAVCLAQFGAKGFKGGHEVG